jgi:hypothetical protein
MPCEAAPCVGFVYLVARPAAPPCAGAPAAPPPLGAAVWRAVGTAAGEPLLGVSAAPPADGDSDGDAPPVLTWLRPCGTLLASLAAVGALLDGRVAAASPCGSRVLVRAAVRCHVGGGARSGAAAAAAAAVLAHLRCDWEADAAAPPPPLPRAPPACSVAGCRLGCGAGDAGDADGDAAPGEDVSDAADASDASALTRTLAALLEDLRPPRVDAAAPLVPKLDEARRAAARRARARCAGLRGRPPGLRCRPPLTRQPPAGAAQPGRPARRGAGRAAAVARAQRTARRGRHLPRAACARRVPRSRPALDAACPPTRCAGLDARARGAAARHATPAVARAAHGGGPPAVVRAACCAALRLRCTGCAVREGVSAHARAPAGATS